MLFDLGWSEILLVGVVALVFIGPKDLPKALRVAGFWVRKARNLSREFQSSIDQMIRESELDEMRQDLEKSQRIRPPAGIPQHDRTIRQLGPRREAGRGAEPFGASAAGRARR